MFYGYTGGIDNRYHDFVQQSTVQRTAGKGKTVLEMMRQDYSTSGGFGEGDAGGRVIGDDEENAESWNEFIQNRRNKKRKINNKEESWWDKRQKRAKERMREQAARSRARQIEHSRLEREYYQQWQIAKNQMQHALLMQSSNGESDTAENPFVPPKMSAAATIPCESMLRAYIAFLARPRVK